MNAGSQLFYTLFYTARPPCFRRPMNASVTCMVTGAVLCLIELGVGSTLLIPSALCGSTLFNAGSFYPEPMNALVHFGHWKLNTLSGHNTVQISEDGGKRTKNILFPTDYSWEATELKDFSSSSPADETSLLSLIRPLLVVSMHCTFLCPKYVGSDCFLSNGYRFQTLSVVFGGGTAGDCGPLLKHVS